MWTVPPPTPPPPLPCAQEAGLEHWLAHLREAGGFQVGHQVCRRHLANRCHACGDDLSRPHTGRRVRTTTGGKFVTLCDACKTHTELPEEEAAASGFYAPRHASFIRAAARASDGGG